MEAIREIVDISNNYLSIRIPDTFNHNRVEVVILPLPTETVTENKEKKSSRGALKQYANNLFIAKESAAWRDSIGEKHENSGC